jgi:hypothetical protein
MLYILLLFHKQQHIHQDYTILRFQLLMLGLILHTYYHSQLQVIHQTPTTTLSTNQDVACNVRQHICKKIIKSEYIDLATLLVTNYDTQPHSIVMHDGQLALQSLRSAQIHSIDQWTSIFILFTSIYCHVHVSRFQELLKYMHLVRLAFSRCA